MSECDAMDNAENAVNYDEEKDPVLQRIKEETNRLLKSNAILQQGLLATQETYMCMIQMMADQVVSGNPLPQQFFSSETEPAFNEAGHEEVAQDVPMAWPEPSPMDTQPQEIHEHVPAVVPVPSTTHVPVVVPIPSITEAPWLEKKEHVPVVVPVPSLEEAPWLCDESKKYGAPTHDRILSGLRDEEAPKVFCIVPSPELERRGGACHGVACVVPQPLVPMPPLEPPPKELLRARDEEEHEKWKTWWEEYEQWSSSWHANHEAGDTEQWEDVEMDPEHNWYQ